MIVKSVLITGALGNLGWKATAALAEDSRFPHVIACDLLDPSEAQAGCFESWSGVEFVRCDLGRWHDMRWRRRMLDVDGVIHFAAQNPFPEASWQDVAVSMDLTEHLVSSMLASYQRQRLVYISSNHVMGGYKDSLFGPKEAAGRLTTDLEPAVGTTWFSGVKTIDSTGYATVKLAGERTSRVAALATSGRVTSVNVRIGWCQPGENHPRTLSAAGSITIEGDQSRDRDEALIETDRWFQEMWLSNQDFAQLMIRSLLASSEQWPEPFITVNGMSNNRGMVWSLEEGKRGLGYDPVDDVYQFLPGR